MILWQHATELGNCMRTRIRRAETRHKTANERENERFLKEQEDLKNLRKKKAEFSKKKELFRSTKES